VLSFPLSPCRVFWPKKKQNKREERRGFKESFISLLQGQKNTLKHHLKKQINKNQRKQTEIAKEQVNKQSHC